jgi:hypothetical protein
MHTIMDILGSICSTVASIIEPAFLALVSFLSGLVISTLENGIPWAIHFGGELAADPLSGLHFTVLAFLFGAGLWACDRAIETVWGAIYRVGVYASFTVFSGSVVGLSVYLITMARA